MKRFKVFALLIVLLTVFSSLSVTAAANGSVFAASAYYVDDTLYAFAQFPDHDDVLNPPKAGLMVHGVQVGGEVSGQKLTESGAPAQYMLLIDNSTSMPAYHARVLALADALLSSGQDVSVTIATFGVRFNVIKEGLTNAADVKKELSKLKYPENGTDICGGAVHAVEHMRSNAWEAGQLAHVILITDGEPFYSRNAQTEAESEAAAAKALQEILAESPQVILHAVCFENWISSVTHEAAASGDGVDAMVQNVEQATDTGNEIAAYCGSFYALKFPLKDYSDDLSLRVSNMQIVSIRRTGDLTVPQTDGPGKFDDLPVVVDTEPDGPKTLPDEDTPDTGATEPPGSADTPEPSENTPSPTETDSPTETEPPNDVEPTEPPENTETPSDEKGILIPVIIGAAAVVVVVVVILLIVLLRRRKTAGASAAPERVPATKAVPGAIPMRLEVLYGSVKGENRQFYLTDEITIGSDPKCDLVLLDGSVSPVNTRIFLRNGAIFVEDMNSASGTAVGGMRIYAPNQLRSGNQILVGQVCIVFYF